MITERQLTIDMNEWQRFQEFLSSLDEADQGFVAIHMEDVLAGRGKTKWTDIYKRVKKSGQSIEDKAYDKSLREIKKLEGDLAPFEVSQLKRLARRRAAKKAIDHQALAFKCRSPKKSPEIVRTNKTFGRFVREFGFATTVGAYVWANRNEKKDRDYFTKLLYETGWNLVSTYVFAGIVNSSSDTKWSMAKKIFSYSRSRGLIDMLVYSAIFSPGKDQQSDLEAHKIVTSEDKEKIKRMGELKEVYYQANFITNLKRRLVSAFKKQIDLGNPLKLNVEDPIVEGGIDWENLTEADLEREEVQNVILTALALEHYNQVKGDWITTGDLGVDRYSYTTLWQIVFLKLDLEVSLYQRYLFCMGKNNPASAWLMSGGIAVAHKFILNQLFYSGRKKATGL